MKSRRVLAGLAALCLFAAAALQCGTESSTFKEGADGPCETVYRGLCGSDCATSEQCPSGLHCAEGKCTAVCVPGGDQCPAGTSCSPRGECLGPGDPGFGDSGSTPTDGGAGDACIDLTVDLAKVVPTVQLLIDQSSTMGADFGGAGPRWNVVRDVLMNPDGGVVPTLQADVSFGLALYTRVGGTPQDASTCPRMLSVAPALGNHGAIGAVYYDAGPTGGTPTGPAIDKLIGRVNGVIVDGGGFATLPTPGPKIIVLATDGEPDSCTDPTDGTPASRALSVGAVQAAYTAGVRTFIIAVGGAVSAGHQQEMANAGAGQPLDGGDAAPFSTTNRAEFVNAINAIIFGVRSCVFTLGGTVAPGSESKGTVTLNGAALPYLGPNGWRLNSPSELEVLGTACQQIKTTDAKLSVRFPCGAFDPR